MTDNNFLFNTWSLVFTLCTSMLNIQTLYILPTQDIDVFVCLNSHFFCPVQYQPVDFLTKMESALKYKQIL